MVEIGTFWKRPNGVVVRVNGERMFRGLREVELVPVSGGGRKSWKWDSHVEFDLSRCNEDGSDWKGGEE
jgi:hypothetical protein